ncbi:MAG TPA: hypothetical protein VGW74_08025 [Propionibacteriaceae bacterium]|nr:hypothetical protein [Propionibacteriaceae bacterium]
MAVIRSARRRNGPQASLVGADDEQRVWCTCGHTSDPLPPEQAESALVRHKAKHRADKP